jgi:hypothetical protein
MPVGGAVASRPEGSAGAKEVPKTGTPLGTSPDVRDASGHAGLRDRPKADPDSNEN